MYSPEKWVENRFVKYPVCEEERGGGWNEQQFTEVINIEISTQLTGFKYKKTRDSIHVAVIARITRSLCSFTRRFWYLVFTRKLACKESDKEK